MHPALQDVTLTELELFFLNITVKDAVVATQPRNQTTRL
jgi:hypothetical protein